MKCPFCGQDRDRVIDSRPMEDGAKIRRRRECQACGKRFSTYEMVETTPLMVVKKDGSRQMFDREKVLAGMRRACVKRKVPPRRLEQAAQAVEKELTGSLEREVPTDRVGQLVMEQLKAIDEVAYVRFASVYREFCDMDSFADEVSRLLQSPRPDREK